MFLLVHMPPFLYNLYHYNSLRRQGTYDAFAADVWAAGVCLWVFRFGTPPFYDPDPANLFLDIIEQPLQFPDEVSEGDEEVLQQEATEKKRAASRAAAKARVRACFRVRLCIRVSILYYGVIWEVGKTFFSETNGIGMCITMPCCSFICAF